MANRWVGIYQIHVDGVIFGRETFLKVKYTKYT